MSDKLKFLHAVKSYIFSMEVLSRLFALFIPWAVMKPPVSRQVSANSLMTGASSFNLLPSLFVLTVLFGVMLPMTQVQSAIIQRTITIDGVMSDWKTPTDITTNPGQFSIDAQNGDPLDLDSPLSQVGRDLSSFSYTFDNVYLSMWVQRYANSSNKTDWWFYLDIDDNGFMETSNSNNVADRVLRVEWSGSNGKTTVRLYDYFEDPSGGVNSTGGGDALVCPLTGANSVADGWCPTAGVADGYDMPGTKGNEATLVSPDAQNQTGGSTSGTSAGVEMETRISWAALGFAGPTSVGFHISSSNGQNIPGNIIDNMNGIGGGGGGIAFSDLDVTKTASVSGVEITSINAGSTFDYVVTVENLGSSDATTVSLDDVLPSGVSYLSHTASVGTTYDSPTDPSPGLWSIGPLANGATVTLTITVFAELVATDTDVTNTANNLLLDQGDPVTTNNQDSAVVTIKSVPEIFVVKLSQTIEDPVNGSSNPKAIPGAIVLYTITIINQGLGVADVDSAIITDPIPTNTELFVGDLSAGSPVAFIDGTTSSGLSLSFISLGSNIDDFEFSDINGYGYTPVLVGDGFDADVTHLRLNTKGIFAASDGTNHPSFTVRFKVRIQ